jgi:hypothetical protein
MDDREALPVGPVPADLPPVTDPQQYQVQFCTSEEHAQLLERAKALLAREKPGATLIVTRPGDAKSERLTAPTGVERNERLTAPNRRRTAFVPARARLRWPKAATEMSRSR